MTTLRSYTRSEEAYTDAALLSSMGFNASVFDERAYGGNLLGSTSGSIRIEVPEEQVADATQLISTRPPKVPRDQPSEPSETASLDELELSRLLRCILIFDTALSLIVTVFGSALAPVAPETVDKFLRSLALSDALWRLAYVSYWPLVGFIIASNLLCLFSLQIGRSLFAFTFVWAILTQLGPPPAVYGPWLGFLGSLQWTTGSIALALMYWSPLRGKFTR